MSNFEKSLQAVAQADVEQLVRKDAEYGSSWKKRGGAGAFFMLARKWDRIENQVAAHGHDIFAAISADQRPEGLIDDIGDLRRYCLLVESEMAARAAGEDQTGQKHPFGHQPGEE